MGVRRHPGDSFRQPENPLISPIDLTWQATPRNKIVGWTDLHINCLHCDAGGSSSGLTFTGLIASREALQRNENHPSSLTQISWTSPVSNRLLLDANLQIGPNFWWGAQQKNEYDPTTIPVQDDLLTITPPNGAPITFTGLNYRSANWSGHTGFTRVMQGSATSVRLPNLRFFPIRRSVWFRRSL